MSSKKKFGWFLSGASIAALAGLAPTAAVAQEAEVSDEIVVTATGRAAAIQDVPIAVQALSGETLEQAGVENLLDLNQVTPTMRIGSGQSTTAGTIASIRGIGTGADNPGFESAVGFFIDGVYRARAGAALADLPELERIEVLRGPQGTLFGKNTSAGAISVITAGPEHEFGAWGEIGAGDRNEAHGSMGLTGGLTDSLALRLDARYRGQDGWINDVTSGRDINSQIGYNIRGQALWDINSDATLRLIVDHGVIDQNCCGAIVIQRGAVIGPLADTFFPGTLLNPATNAPLRERNMTLTPFRSYAEEAEDNGVSGELSWDMGGVELTSITAWRSWQANRDQDIDFASFDRAYRDDLEIGFDNVSQEIRLQGEAGNINWLVGGFYSNEEMDTTDRIRFGDDAHKFVNAAFVFLTSTLPGGPYRAYVTNDLPGPVRPCLLVAFGGSCLPDIVSGQGQTADHWNIDTNTFALFTHNEISLGENLIWTVGLRYTLETKDLTADLSAVNGACDSLRGANRVPALTAAGFSSSANVLFALACNAVSNTLANGTHEGNREENELSGTTSLAFHVSDDMMIYGGYSRGYKAGGFNADRSAFFGPGNLTPTDLILPGTDAIDFEPEFTDSYEIGLKSDIFGGTTTFNITGFYQLISDYQQNSFSGFNFFTQNVEEVVSQGIELEMSGRPTDNFGWTFGALYNEATYESDTLFGADLVPAGTPLAQAPEFTVTASIDYSQPLYFGMIGTVYLNGRYVSDARTQTLGRNPITDNNEYAIFDGRVGIGPEDGRWSADVFVRNLTDEFYHVGGFGAPERTLPTALDPTRAGGNYLIYPNEPRTIGVSLRARY